MKKALVLNCDMVWGEYCAVCLCIGRFIDCTDLYPTYVLVQADTNSNISNAWRKLAGPNISRRIRRMKIGSEVRLHIIFSNPSNIQSETKEKNFNMTLNVVTMRSPLRDAVEVRSHRSQFRQKKAETVSLNFSLWQ